MKLIVAGRDRTRDLGEALERQARNRPASALTRRIADERDVLALKASDSESVWLDRHLDLLRNRNCLDTNAFAVCAGRGPAGRLLFGLRRFFWKILRYQHDWHVFQQNSVNVQLSYGLEFERDERRRQAADLDRRMQVLEARVGGKTRRPEGC